MSFQQEVQDKAKRLDEIAVSLKFIQMQLRLLQQELTKTQELGLAVTHESLQRLWNQQRYFMALLKEEKAQQLKMRGTMK